jgi:hypothetical protein
MSSETVNSGPPGENETRIKAKCKHCGHRYHVHSRQLEQINRGELNPQCKTCKKPLALILIEGEGSQDELTETEQKAAIVTTQTGLELVLGKVEEVLDLLRGTQGQTNDKPVDRLEEIKTGLRALQNEIVAESADERQPLQAIATDIRRVLRDHVEVIRELRSLYEGKYTSLAESYVKAVGEGGTLVKLKQSIVTRAERLKTDFEQVKGASTQAAERLEKTVEGLKAAIDFQNKRLEELQETNTELEKYVKGEMKQWLGELADKLNHEVQESAEERLKEIKQFHKVFLELMEDASKSLNRAQAETEKEFRTEFETVRQSYAAVRKQFEEATSPQGLRRLLGEYHKDMAKQSDAESREMLVQHLPQLFDIVEEELISWQRASKQANATEVDKRVAEVLENIQNRIEGWQRGHRLVRFPALGELFDIHKHKSEGREAASTAADVNRVKDVVNSGYSFQDDGRLLRQATVVVWGSRSDQPDDAATG